MITSIDKYFEEIREGIIGHYYPYQTPYGEMKILYADWVASGRLYAPIEKIMLEKVAPFIANTHTEASETGTLMTKAYHYAHKKIKEHSNAGKDDVIITAGFGMTTVVNKFQRMLGLKHTDRFTLKNIVPENERPVVFITHMEHHSNHTSWFETSADIVQLQPDENLLINLDELEFQLKKYKDRKIKYGSFTACSNVTGIETPYHKMAKLMHKYGGWCFVDFAASAPYVKIDMHPEDIEEKLDAIFFSPHKFLGGPGTSGVLIFDSKLYHNYIPDQPGGGTVNWTNPWGEFKYIDDIEVREDGGTPGFLQAIRAALCIVLKEKMGIENIGKKEDHLVKISFEEIRKIPNLHILADNVEKRLGIISFYIDNIHYNLIVKLLSDKFGIQVRGGCACAGTYGHYLLNVSYSQSKEITNLIDHGDLSLKPGWVRLSLHPTMTEDELRFVIDAIKQIGDNYKEWGKDYIYNKHTNEFKHKDTPEDETGKVLGWFDLDE
jgi:selenocysteine lyase/cysteine desulfurase